MRTMWKKSGEEIKNVRNLLPFIEANVRVNSFKKRYNDYSKLNK